MPFFWQTQNIKQAVSKFYRTEVPLIVSHSNGIWEQSAEVNFEREKEELTGHRKLHK
jgi:hypothetical protein